MSTTSESLSPKRMSATEEESEAKTAGIRSGWWKVHVAVGILAVLYVWSVEHLRPTYINRRTTTATVDATNIFKALMMYSSDHEGKFPEGLHSSNEAFRKLFSEGYIETERTFHVPDSAWHQTAMGGGPDNDFGSPPDFLKCLEAGENHWAYLSGLQATDPLRLPIVMDGFVAGEPGAYTNDPSAKGGIWKGQMAVVVYLDGSARQEKLDRRTFRVRRPQPDGSGAIDPLAKENLPSGTTLLNPE